jgi:AcrR family transcriptional regulator
MGRTAARVLAAWPRPATELGEIVEQWWAASMPSPVARDVLLAAIELFAERGYHATTTRDIATRVGMSTGAMYAYFRSKEELLFEISFVGHSHATDAVAAAAQTDAPPATQLADMVRLFASYHARFRTIAKIVHDELYGMTSEHLADVLAVRRRTEAVVEDVIGRGVAAGTCDVADIPAVARALLSLCIDVARWYQPDHGSTPEQVGDLYAELALRMVGARPAHRDGVSAH